MLFQCHNTARRASEIGVLLWFVRGRNKPKALTNFASQRAKGG
jgi:hypothetical protein